MRSWDTIGIKLVVKNNKLKTTVTINNDEVNFYSDFFAFLLSKDNIDKNRWDVESLTQKETSLLTDFYPFTCNCGHPGCLGIWKGIRSKHRKLTVQWRVPRESGYESILKKHFYQFHADQYEFEIAKIWRWMNNNKDVVIREEHYSSLDDGDFINNPDDSENEVITHTVGDELNFLLSEDWFLERKKWFDELIIKFS